MQPATVLLFILIRPSLSDSLGCIPERCEPDSADTFYSYRACCSEECCVKLRFWVIPTSLASVGFAAGAFFALCFQCR